MDFKTNTILKIANVWNSFFRIFKKNKKNIDIFEKRGKDLFLLLDLQLPLGLI